MGLGITEAIAVMEGLGYGTRDQGLLFAQCPLVDQHYARPLL